MKLLPAEKLDRRREHYATRQNYLSAKAAGKSTYDGPECPKPGHGRRKYTISRQCAACKAEYDHAYHMGPERMADERKRRRREDQDRQVTVPMDLQTLALLIVGAGA